MAQNEEYEIQQANENKQPQSTTITVRVPYSLKARLYDLSEQSKMTLNAYVATRIYKYVHGELVEPDKANDDQEGYNDLKRSYQQLQEAYNQLVSNNEQLQHERNRLAEENAKDESQKTEREQILKKELKETTESLQKANEEIEKLSARPTQNQLEQYKARPTKNQFDTLEEKYDRLKDERDELHSQYVEMREQLEKYEALVEQMQYYINRHAHGLFRKPYQFIEGVPLDPDEPEQ